MAAVNLIGSYNYALVALSVLIAMLASYAALDLAGRVTAAGCWTRASGLVCSTVVFAVLVSFVELWITFHSRGEKTGSREKLAGAVVMGAAIPVMHYTGMAAASFTSSGMPADLSHAVSVSTLGTAGIAAVTFIVLGLALLTSWMDRRFAAQTLELERKHWRSLTEALPQLVWAATPDAATDYFSTQWTEYTGVPEAGLLGWRWMEVLHPDDRENTQQARGDSVAGRRPYDVEYRVRRHDGAYGWFKTRGAPIRDRKGDIVKWFGSCTDITHGKRGGEALREKEQGMRNVSKAVARSV